MIASLRAMIARQWRDYARWIVCFAFVLFIHVGGAIALLARWDHNELTSNPPSILIDLSPMAMAPEAAPVELPVGPQQVETPPEELEQLPPPPPPPLPAEVTLDPPKPPETPPEKPAEKPVEKKQDKPKEKKKVAKLTTAPAPAPRKSQTAAMPMAGAGAHDSSAVPNWKSTLVSRLENNKRYPADARSRGEQGVAYLAFSVDRAGGVHGARITRSSGSSALDQETIALATRVSPLPPPPPEMAGSSIPIVVPIRYNIR